MPPQLLIADHATSQRGSTAEIIGAPKDLLIDGQWQPSVSGETFETIDPTTEQVLTTVASAGPADVDLAVAAARRALEAPAWSAMKPYDRTRVLLAIADRIEANADELAALDTFDNGAPLWLTSAMVASAVETFRYYAGWPTKMFGQTTPTAPNLFAYTVREPVGVCAGIVPWNAPILMAAWKIAPALACGNTTILKPAEQTPLSALRLGELILEAGTPPGVVNVLTGPGQTGAALVDHPGVDKVAFTGSTEVGKSILRASTVNLKRVTLELGGKSPNIIFADADLDKAIATAASGFLTNSGQVCAAGTRIFVQQEVHADFLDALTKQVENYSLGDPFHPDTRMGPLVSREQFDRVGSYLDLGKAEGAVPRTGGERIEGTGYFVPPTIFDATESHMRIVREEIFGPVASVIPFHGVEDAVLQGNDTIYGLAAAVWTRDVSKAYQVSRAIKAGSVVVNSYGGTDVAAPFGGYKQSGVGRELGPQSLDSYTEIKTVTVHL